MLFLQPHQRLIANAEVREGSRLIWRQSTVVLLSSRKDHINTDTDGWEGWFVLELQCRIISPWILSFRFTAIPDCKTRRLHSEQSIGRKGCAAFSIDKDFNTIDW